MMEDKPYQNHVSSAPDNKEVCHLCSLKNCEVAIVFKLEVNLSKPQSSKWCFVPHSVVDFYKKEQ